MTTASLFFIAVAILINKHDDLSYFWNFAGWFFLGNAIYFYVKALL